MGYAKIDVLERNLRQRTVVEPIPFESGTNPFCANVLLDIDAKVFGFSRHASITKTSGFSPLLQART
jgi:hypothetical protein